MPSPHIRLSECHHLTFCSASSLVGAAPVSRRLRAPDADADADADGADDGSDGGSDDGDGSDDAATHATTPAFDADAARRCRRRLRPPKPLLPTTPLHGSTRRRPRPRPSAAPHPSPPLSPMLRRSRRLTARPPRIRRAHPLSVVFCLCLVRRLSSVVGGVSMSAACWRRHLATCVCSCNMMIAQVTHALLAPGAGRPTVLHSRQGRGRAAAVER